MSGGWLKVRELANELQRILLHEVKQRRLESCAILDAISDAAFWHGESEYLRGHREGLAEGTKMEGELWESIYRPQKEGRKSERPT